MMILLTENEVLEVASFSLDLNQPNSDKLHDIALKMDMKYMELLDLFWDEEEHWLRYKQYQQNKQLS